MSQTDAFKVKEIEHTMIPMPDGCHLAARIWMPEDAVDNPVPAILEYIPYRKRDFTALRDSNIHRFFAQNGYASIRVDLRGSGDSEGVLYDEYLPQELEDGLEILKWIAKQPWNNGSVGMIGLSWGGFNGLQIAALAPPELQAVITVCSSDDRYADDVHYMGGCLLSDNLSWASTMFAYGSCPPDPMLAGEKWRDMWLERLQGSGLWLKNWLKHQRRDSFWKHASVCEDYSKIQCPIYAVSGWADGYSNTVFRLLENLSVPTKGLVGAWSHKYPHMGNPGPAIGFLSESLRWWDHWLKGKDTGIMDEPRLRVWMQDSISPLSDKRPGRWVAEPGWPSNNVQSKEYFLTERGLSEEQMVATDVPEAKIQSPLSVGLFAGKWCSYSAYTDLPSDQREEDGGALVFESEPLEDTLEILGAPKVHLQLRSNKHIAMVAARLCDVSPDGKATRITYGLLNLTHRNSDENPEELEVDKLYSISVPMNYIAQSFSRGHRLRLSISTSYWPLAWPSPEPVMLSIALKNSRLEIPVRPPSELDQHLPKFPSADAAPSIAHTLLSPPHREWKVEHNLANNQTTLHVTNNDAKYRLEDINWTFYRKVAEKYSYSSNRYDTVKGEVSSERRFSRGDWNVVIYTRTVLTSNRTHFRILATLDAYEGDARIYSQSWDELIPRDFV